MNTLDEYQDAAWRTAANRDDKAFPAVVRKAIWYLEAGDPHERKLGAELRNEHLKNVWALGLAGESGEVADLQKKVTGHGRPYDREKLKKELGDVLWYVAALAKIHDMTLSEIAQGNVDKLLARHPEGFTVESAAAKADEGTQRDWLAEHVERAVVSSGIGSPSDE